MMKKGESFILLHTENNREYTNPVFVGVFIFLNLIISRKLGRRNNVLGETYLIKSGDNLGNHVV